MSPLLFVVWAATLVPSVICALSAESEVVSALKKQYKELEARVSRVEDSCVKGMTDKVDYGEFIKKDGWTLVFRATAGIGKPVYDAWTRVGYHDDYQFTRATMPCGCTRTSGSCDRHYRSRLLDSWPSAVIEKVKLALYENGKETAWMIFSGHGTSYMNWFSAGRLAESSWKDLKSVSHDFFSIVGLQPEIVYRRFYISNRNIHCPDDVGWLNIKDRGNACPWEASNQIPAFVYSKAETMINWQNVGSLRGFADVMAVWVKFDESLNLMQKCLP